MLKELKKIKFISLILSLIVIPLFLGCSNDEKKLSGKYLKLNWNDGEKIVFENGHIHSYTHFDSIQNKMVGDSLIPIIVKDSTIIITEILQKRNLEIINGEVTTITESDTIIHRDTIMFEIRNFNGPKLLLHIGYIRLPQVYNLDKKEKDNLKEIIHFNNVRFEIAGLSIGDTINREDFKFKDVSNYDLYSFEEAELRSNDDIEVNIIGDKYILKIIQHGISKSDLVDVIKVVSSKLNQEPEHQPTKKDGEYETEYYRWDKNGVSISLQRMIYVGNNYLLKNAFSKDWHLYYMDNIIEALLINEFKNGVPKSSIIK